MLQLSEVVSFQMTQYFINKHIKLRDFEPTGRKSGHRIEHTLTSLTPSMILSPPAQTTGEALK